MLGERWYAADDDPVALLRAEARFRNPGVAERLCANFGPRPCRVLDIGCGGGFLTNYLAAEGHMVTGVDAEQDALEVARLHDLTRSVQYVRADACNLPYDTNTFDAVCAMDVLEHVADPGCVIAEAARVLRPDGLFFFHTFNRNLLSWLVVIKGVEWFVANTPADMHVLHLFLRPDELSSHCRAHGLMLQGISGVRPRLGRAFFRMLRTRRVSDEFAFTACRSTQLAYSGVAKKTRGGSPIQRTQCGAAARMRIPH